MGRAAITLIIAQGDGKIEGLVIYPSNLGLMLMLGGTKRMLVVLTEGGIRTMTRETWLGLYQKTLVTLGSKERVPEPTLMGEGVVLQNHAMLVLVKLP